ncbi:MAG: pre-peptidase C-terminal domain-containing protein [Gemmata sp.]
MNTAFKTVGTCRFFFNLCLSAIVCGAASAAPAAPPAVTHLSPAGAQRGTTVEVAAAGLTDSGAKVWSSNRHVSVEHVKGKLKVAVAKDAAPGVCWLRAHNADGASAPRPFIVGTLPELTENEPNDDFRKPHALAGPAVVNGKLDKAGDVDCFAVQLKRGQTLVASLQANSVLRSPVDAILQLVSTDGFVIDENHDYSGLDPQLAYTAPKDGTYVVRLYAFPSTPDSSIRFFGSEAAVYRLTLTTGAFAEAALPLAVKRGLPWRGELTGWNLTREASKLTLHASHEDDPFARAYSGELANAVRVRHEPHAVDAPGARETLQPPFSATGRIEKRNEEVRFAVQLKKGQALTLQAESRALGLACDPIVRVVDAEGKQIARAEPGKLNSDTTLAFTPAADGTYTVAVSDLFGGYWLRHAFLLRALSEPDYDLSVAADRFTLTPGQPLAVPVKVTRVRGFAKPVEVVAEGLPAGVKFEITAPAKPDPNTVTVSLTSEKLVSGAFRLVGKVKDAPELTRTARAPLTEFDDATADLWLTVAPAAPPAKK